VAETVEEEKSGTNDEASAPSESESADSKLQLPETVLVDALRRFVRHEAQDSAQPEEKPVTPQIGLFQAIVLLVVVLDIVLLYGEFQDWFDNPLFKEALKVLPWLLGATAFAYSDRLREWALAQCKHKALAVIAIFVALPLLIIRQPVFSVIVSTASDSIAVNADDLGDKLALTTLDPRHFRITVPNLLKPYSIKVVDTDEDLHPVDFPQRLGRWRVIRGTFAQLPLIGKLFKDSALQLKTLYKVMTISTASGGSAIVEGQFDEQFLQQVSGVSKLRCTQAPSASSGLKAIRCRVPKGIDAFPLPEGRYNFKLSRDGCKDNHTISGREVPDKGDVMITLDDLCPS
jgi:hypothetical protein